MCTCYPIINRVSELKVHIELTRFVQPEKIEIDANERAVYEKSQYCFFVCTTFDSFLNDLENWENWICRTDKNTLGTKGRTSILSYREYVRPAELHSRSAEKKLPDRECFVTSFRQGGYTPLRR